MERLLCAQSHIVVVDSRPRDYRDLAGLAGRYGWHVHFLTSARAAIRFSRMMRAELWMISVQLPDSSGFELFQALAPSLAESCVLLVADAYDAQDEARACRAGATLYLCKDAQGAMDFAALVDLLVVRRGSSGEARFSGAANEENSGSHDPVLDPPSHALTHRNANLHRNPP